MIKLAINGYGRIGRNILKAFYESHHHNSLKIVAINDLADAKVNAHLTRFDTAHGKFPFEVRVADGNLVINSDPIRVCSERDPSKLPWKELDIDVVLECTGFFTDGHKARAHLEAGAKKVIISAPATNVDATIVYGVNHHLLNPSQTIISNASCTTNCLAPIAKILNDAVGIENGLMTTVHSYTNDQVLTDVYHPDLRRARSATHSMIPTKTGAASALGLVLPELQGKLDGLAIRVPTINVSLVDLTFTAGRATSVAEINALLAAAATGSMQNIVAYTEEPLVSVDFNHTTVSATVDALETKVIGQTLVKVLAWYDNEWGFSNRMLDVAKAWF